MGNDGIGGHILAFTGTTRSVDTDGLGGHLAALRAAGYASVELMGLGADPALVADSGLDIAGCHGVPADWRDLRTTITGCRRLGCSDLCSSGPLAWNARTPDDYRRTAAELNRLGSELRSAGIHLHYHNHAFEFEPLTDGGCGFELLLAELDPAACGICLDLGWVHRAGRDPVALLDDQAARITYVHLRDFAGERSTPLGAGAVPIAPQLPAIDALPVCRHVVVEQDGGGPDPADDMAASLDHLRTLDWVSAGSPALRSGTGGGEPRHHP